MTWEGGKSGEEIGVRDGEGEGLEPPYLQTGLPKRSSTLQLRWALKRNSMSPAIPGSAHPPTGYPWP